MTIVDFIEARLTEREAAAIEAADGRGMLALAFAANSPVPQRIGEWMQADVAAKRALLDDIFRYESGHDGEFGCSCKPETIRAGHCPDTPLDEIDALRHLAAIDRAHPECKESWKP